MGTYVRTDSLYRVPRSAASKCLAVSASAGIASAACFFFAPPWLGWTFAAAAALFALLAAMDALDVQEQTMRAAQSAADSLKMIAYRQ